MQRAWQIGLILLCASLPAWLKAQTLQKTIEEVGKEGRLVFYTVPLCRKAKR